MLARSDRDLRFVPAHHERDRLGPFKTDRWQIELGLLNQTFYARAFFTLPPPSAQGLAAQLITLFGVFDGGGHAIRSWPCHSLVEVHAAQWPAVPHADRAELSLASTPRCARAPPRRRAGRTTTAARGRRTTTATAMGDAIACGRLSCDPHMCMARMRLCASVLWRVRAAHGAARRVQPSIAHEQQPFNSHLEHNLARLAGGGFV